MNRTKLLLYEAILKYKFFELFFYLGIVETFALFAAFYTLPNGGGKLAFGGGSDDPLQTRRQAVLGQREVSQLQLSAIEKSLLVLYPTNRNGGGSS